jgi:hypothetical protein
MGEAESNEDGDEHPSEKPGTLRGIIVTAAFYSARRHSRRFGKRMLRSWHRKAEV